jgi:hypothetical protein
MLERRGRRQARSSAAPPLGVDGRVDTRPAGARDARREGVPNAADLRNAEWVSAKPRRERRIARAIPLGPGFTSESRVAAKARNPEHEMRFPAFREDGDNALALSPVRGGRSRHALAKRARSLNAGATSDRAGQHRGLKRYQPKREG